MALNSGRRVLAIDYGRKRTGLAISDELRTIARPLLVLPRVNRAADIRQLREICRANGVGLIIVGDPLHLTGEVSEMSEEARRFAKRLQRELGIDVQLVDERLTSWEAAQMSAQAALPRRTTECDDVAAAILLREYLGRLDSRPLPAEGA